VERSGEDKAMQCGQSHRIAKIVSDVEKIDALSFLYEYRNIERHEDDVFTWRLKPVGCFGT
jgi:hypothetical protein